MFGKGKLYQIRKLKGKSLDRLGKLYGMKRERKLRFFKESDRNYRIRLKDYIATIVNTHIS